MNGARTGDLPQPGVDRLDGLWPRPVPVVMAVLNRTPDSFSDGGRFLDDEDGLRHAERLIADGADIVDIGGESTRPGADPVPAVAELLRVVPMVAELRRRRPGVVISVDTSKFEVAEAALEAGADLVNDVTAAADGRMLGLVAERGAAIVLMHMRGSPATMQLDTVYSDVVAEVRDFLGRRAEAAVAAGVPAHRVWIDPGIGFGKDVDGNLKLLAALPELAALGHPVVVGPSRKSFLGRLTGAPVDGRLAGSLAALVPTIGLERAVVRVHDPGPTVHFLEVACRLRGAAP
ncbi:MAG TPA: dihydropteroate synthase [Thermoanaerobaculales bacterium]|nr:dihydropteroate synthase [Thermoanaerobaculales bacterium]HPA79601.1 dihydropteroate synthase [Thermoanaerobaculales bacterium]HQL30635.1 dihydropteroate synthase [Thermoanaerobaculales bacterium]HQN97410.1 dihydropteroate synthase [Thermoanaerobaculales bacterium]